MSATNRGGLARQPFDFYETPPLVVRSILEALGLGEGFDGFAVDAGAGAGRILRELARACPRADVVGVELQEEKAELARHELAPNASIVEGDFLTWEPSSPRVDLVISNPPFSLAKEFAERAIALTSKTPRSQVALLLPVSFLGSRKRGAFHLAHPSDVFFLNPRPSFNGSGTDSVEYAWFVWGARHGGKWKILSGPKGWK